MLTEVARRGLLKGKTIGIDATTLEANAAMPHGASSPLYRHCLRLFPAFMRIHRSALTLQQSAAESA